MMVNTVEHMTSAALSDRLEAIANEMALAASQGNSAAVAAGDVALRHGVAALLDRPAASPREEAHRRDVLAHLVARVRAVVDVIEAEANRKLQRHRGGIAYLRADAMAFA